MNPHHNSLLMAKEDLSLMIVTLILRDVYRTGKASDKGQEGMYLIKF